MTALAFGIIHLAGVVPFLSFWAERKVAGETEARLAGYKAPTTIEFRDAIPRTATGKIQKFKLREHYWAGRDRQVN